MREILFRGVETDREEWVYGYLIHDSVCNSTVPYIGYLSHEQADTENRDVVPVIPETVGQYTGITDKNGNKIFEGDIIKTHYANANKSNFVERVEFEKGKFCAIYENDGCKIASIIFDGTPHLKYDKSVYMDEVEVIGNVYDNSELLR